MVPTNPHDKIFQLIGRYALLLAGLYIIEQALKRYFRELELDLSILAVSSYGISLALNLTTWLIVSKDRRELAVKTSYVDLATILYRPLGVVAFLLYVMYPTSPAATDGIGKAR